MLYLAGTFCSCFSWYSNLLSWLTSKWWVSPADCTVTVLEPSELNTLVAYKDRAWRATTVSWEINVFSYVTFTHYSAIMCLIWVVWVTCVEENPPYAFCCFTSQLTILLAKPRSAVVSESAVRAASSTYELISTARESESSADADWDQWRRDPLGHMDKRDTQWAWKDKRKSSETNLLPSEIATSSSFLKSCCRVSVSPARLKV